MLRIYEMREKTRRPDRSYLYFEMIAQITEPSTSQNVLLLKSFFHKVSISNGSIPMTLFANCLSIIGPINV